MWVLESFIEELKTVKGQRNALFIGLVVALVIMFKSCSGDTDIDGNLTVTGDITAQNYIVSSSVTSINYQSISRKRFLFCMKK